MEGGIADVKDLHLTIAFCHAFYIILSFFFSEISSVIYTVEGEQDEGKYSVDVSFLYPSEEARDLTCSLRFPPCEDKEL